MNKNALERCFPVNIFTVLNSLDYIRTKVPAANNIWEDKSGYRKNPARTVRKERHRNNRSYIMQGPCAYAVENTAEIQRVGYNGISERQKLADDIRPACEPEIQVRQPAFLAQGVLRGHRGQKCEKIGEYIRNQLQEDSTADQLSLNEHIEPFTGEPVKRGKK